MTEKPTYEQLEQRIQKLEESELARRQAEKALWESSQRLQKVFDAQPDAILIITSGIPARVVECNASATDVFGYEINELIGKTTSKLHVDDTHIMKFQQILCSAIEKKGYLDKLEFTMKRKDGTAFPSELTVMELEDNKGGRSGWILIISDITEQKNNEEALRKSEERFRLLSDLTMEGILIHKLGIAKDMNSSLAELLGYKREELFGKNFLEFVHPEDRQRVQENIVKDYAYPYVVRGVKKNGDVFWAELEARNFVVRDEKLRVVAVRDITDRKKADEALRESENRFQRMLSVIPDMISIHSPQMDILYSNWTGYGAVPESKRILNTKCYRTYRDFDDVCPDCQAKSVLASREPFQEEMQLPDGTWVDLRVIPILGEDNCVEMFMEWVRDITKRKQTEEALVDERSFLSAVLDNIEEAIVTCDREGRLLRFNEAARRLHGFPEQPIPPDQWTDYYDLYRMDGARPLPTEEIPLFRALKGERVQNAEIVVAPKHGGARSMVCSGQALTSGAGEVIGAVVAMHDITERKKAEEEIRQRNSELAALNAIGAMVNQSLNLEIVLESSLKETMAVLNAEGGLIYLFDETSGTFSPVSHQGISPDMLRELAGFRWGQGLSGRVAETGKPVVTALGEDARNVSPTSIPEGFRFYAGVPITSKNKVLGVMSLVTRQENVFKPQHLSLLGQIGNQIGVAVENAHLYEWARRDLAKLEEAEKALRQSEARYRDLFENVSDFIYFHDMEGNFIETNLAFKSVYGYQNKEMEPVNARDMMPKEKVHQFDEYLERIKKYGTDEGYFKFSYSRSRPI